MNNFNVIDAFLQTFIRYIDSGFGLLGGDVAGLASILIVIDVTLAALFWLLDGEMNVFARLIKKVLYVGAFAFIINNFPALANIVFNSFSQLGLHASNNGLTAQDLLRPGKLAGTGFQAAWPLLQEAGKLLGFTSFFSHAVTILVLVGAWFIVVLAFFILAVQLFITILEFKLTTLAGFVLVPFALWNKTAFLAERVLGNVVSSGVKVMVLAVIIGIGSSFFGQFTGALKGDPTLASAMTLVLAALSLFGLGIFGPGIASGLVSGAPQLGAGAAIGSGAALVGGAALTGAAGIGAVRALGGGGMAAIRAATSLSSGAATAYGLAAATSGESGAGAVGAGLAGVARAAAGGARTAASNMASGLRQSADAGAQAAWRATGGTRSGSSATESGPPNPGGAAGDGGSAHPPAWARRLSSQQRRRGHVQNIHQAIKEGDKPMHGATPDLGEEG
ncbi:MAG: P-type conjugative transfer protein TrbL [Alphaproteobacteria bacterium]|nr:P-type conjugative transfer protein TrbL [Alphaproteobacteria bacterium]